jgi:pyruvate dehydrogenase E2 component (dihydrolipoamide acetyltransferase)
MPEVVMPRLSDSMEEGTILRWLKSSGEEVSRGEEIVEIETDKATMTYEADFDGVLAVVASEGSTLPIGAVIATIGDGAAPAPAANGSAAVPTRRPRSSIPRRSRRLRRRWLTRSRTSRPTAWATA